MFVLGGMFVVFACHATELRAARPRWTHAPEPSETFCLNLRFLITDGAKRSFMFGIASFLLGHVAYVLALVSCAPAALLFTRFARMLMVSFS